MDHFLYRGGILCAEDVSIPEIAKTVGTPFYVYSCATLTRHYQLFKDALEGVDNLVCFAMKANSNQAVIAHLAGLGAGGGGVPDALGGFLTLLRELGGMFAGDGTIDGVVGAPVRQVLGRVHESVARGTAGIGRRFQRLGHVAHTGLVGGILHRALEIARHAANLRGELAEFPEHAGQVLGADDDQRHDPNDE